MPRYEKAQWKPVETNYQVGGCEPRLVIAHIMQGTLAGTDGWFRNSAAQVSAHFGVGRDGTLIQWVDTKDRAWHAAEANTYAIGVEHEGFAGEPLTDAQITATAGILAWAHREHPEIALWRNTRPFTGRGLSWHGLGGTRWGGHTHCPGEPIRDQLHTIVEEARARLDAQAPVTGQTGP